MKANRRTIVKGLMAAGTLPLFNMGCAHFGESRARQIAKGAKVRVALIGCGLQTHAMIDGVLCENLVAIVDPDPARFVWLEKYVADTCTAEARANFATARRFATYQDMFDKMGIPYKREHLNIPPKVLEVEKANGFANDPFYKNGVLFRGTKGDLWFTHHGGYRFMPRKNGWCIPRVDRPDDFNYRLVTPKHFHEFYEAIRTGEQTIDNFEYAVPLAKTVCLGNISALAGKGSVLEWDGAHVTNNKEANKHVTKNYRSGWNPFV